MRYLFLTVLLVSAMAAPVSAQSVPTLPSLTFPEEGTFCAPFTLCPKETIKAPR